MIMSPSSLDPVGLKHGFRSGLEDKIAKDLKAKDVAYAYEETIINYDKPASKHKYHPDFTFSHLPFILETKGRFLTADRQKHLLIKEQHPHLDIRFLFSNSKTRLSKISKTTYADWCRKHGFKFADKVIPEAWLKETANV